MRPSKLVWKPDTSGHWRNTQDMDLIREYDDDVILLAYVRPIIKGDKEVFRVSVMSEDTFEFFDTMEEAQAYTTAVIVLREEKEEES